MKDIIWLSPSLAAGAIAARLVVFLERRTRVRSRWPRSAPGGRQPDGLRNPPAEPRRPAPPQRQNGTL